MPYTTYSFNDVKMVISNPNFNAFTLNGQGVGEININWSNENSSHNLAADGSVMINKIAADNGTLTISAQQTSMLHQWLKDLFNFLKNSPSNVWASSRIDLSSIAGYDNGQFSGVTFAKRSDVPYQQQGQLVTWTFLFASGQIMGSAAPNIALSTQGNLV